ncbi:MAG TPA: hypothetical protein VNA20_11330 [Frankiaceae bacterium]|nr:hypothetical protein [Frankiaceae bacterium]
MRSAPPVPSVPSAPSVPPVPYFAPPPLPPRLRRWGIGPGHVVWGPVAYMDNPGVAKDRPVLIVGREPGAFLVLTLSSQEKRSAHADWFPLGVGNWDRRRRRSWARLQPWYRLPDAHVRRPGGVVDPVVFAQLRGLLATKFGWKFPEG